MYQQPYYNPSMQNAQQRLQMMEAQYPPYSPNLGMQFNQPNFNSQNMSTPMIKGRPVANEQEANAAMIDFDGSINVFVDKTHKKIYTKQLGLDGNIIFNRYVQEDPTSSTPEVVPSPAVDLSGYVKQETLEEALSSMSDRIAKLEQKNTAKGAAAK